MITPVRRIACTVGVVIAVGLASCRGSAVPGKGSLSKAQIDATVAEGSPRLERQCWQPALARRPRDAPPHAHVTASVTVASNGGVEEVTTRGDPAGYRGLSACVAAKVRTWKFPEAGGRTTVTIPFVFDSK